MSSVHKIEVYGKEGGKAFLPEISEEYRVVIVNGNGDDVYSYPFPDELSATEWWGRVVDDWRRDAENGDPVEPDRKVEIRRVVHTVQPHVVVGAIVRVAR